MVNVRKPHTADVRVGRKKRAETRSKDPRHGPIGGEGRRRWVFGEGGDASQVTGTGAVEQ